ncbi:MAG: hypothetical protein ACJA1H_002777 [Glaciecola sp.]|jgi:hypothetical protein
MKFKLALLTLCFCFLNCKEESKTASQNVDFDYKYPSIEKLIDCEGIDTRLLQEAVQSFEEDLANFYTPERPILSRAYSLFISQALFNKADYSTIVSDHSKKVLEALKQDENLWTTNPDGSKLNFNHPVFKCIGENIKDQPLKKTFNALITTNSMSLRMFGDQLKRKTFGMKDDKYLATYVALELYFGKIHDKDLSAKAENDVDTKL